MIDEFLSNKKTYKIAITLDNCKGTVDSLDPENLDMFSYSNEMNRLYTKGFIEYTDRNAIVDKFIESQYCECLVEFQKLKIDREGEIEKKSIENCITLNFVVNNVEILENTTGQIRYKIHLTGKSYIGLNKNIMYTTYGDKMKSPTDIIKDILQNNSDIGINADSFDTNKSTTEIDYIAGENDDSFSSIKFLLNRMCYNRNQKDDSIKSLVYDEGSNTIFLFDTKTDGKKLGIFRSPIEIKVLKDAMNMDYDVPVYIGYVSRKQRLDSILNTKTMRYFNYDIESNKFGNKDIEEKTIQHIFAGSNESGGKMSVNVGEKFVRYENEWNNNIDIYDTMFDAITKTNGLIVNQYGEIGTIPGFCCQVSIPNTFPIGGDDKERIVSEKIKYQSFTGRWDIFKVEHFISPRKELFRQKLILYRNWI